MPEAKLDDLEPKMDHDGMHAMLDAKPRRAA
jgi:hypothetical protein